jgi:hypothetical protein
MGVLQAVEPKRCKEGNRPACLVGTVRFDTPFPATAFALDASQPPAYIVGIGFQAPLLRFRHCPFGSLVVMKWTQNHHVPWTKTLIFRPFNHSAGASAAPPGMDGLRFDVPHRRRCSLSSSK